MSSTFGFCENPPRRRVAGNRMYDSQGLHSGLRSIGQSDFRACHGMGRECLYTLYE